MSNMPEVKHLFTLAGCAASCSWRGLPFVAIVCPCVGGPKPKPGRHIDTIAIRSSRATDLYLWLACMTMSFMLAKVSGWMFIDLILLLHSTLFLSLPEWQHHHHNIRITTSTGGQRLFLDVCMWVCDVHSGTVTSVIMLFRHSYIVGE